MAQRYQNNFYELIGLEKFASEEKVKEAYRKLARKFHPDLGGSDQIMKDLNIVYEILTKGKDQYDQWLRSLERPTFTVTMTWSASHGTAYYT